ncbi:MAG: hypothetical protein RBR20_13710 [Desulfobacterales bacterium]|jgi:hypothetical protein|nr:hypothetical protein [Desulfobacterales bacterium]
MPANFYRGKVILETGSCGKIKMRGAILVGAGHARDFRFGIGG